MERDVRVSLVDCNHIRAVRYFLLWSGLGRKNGHWFYISYLAEILFTFSYSGPVQLTTRSFFRLGNKERRAVAQAKFDRLKPKVSELEAELSRERLKNKIMDERMRQVRVHSHRVRN